MYANQLFLNRNICHFTVKGVIGLGYKVSQKGLHVDKEKIEEIENLPRPILVNGLASFLRNVGFYRDFIKDLSKFELPLCMLFEKEAKFYFDNACVAVFMCL